jgi:hypothetical protein
VPCQNWLTVGGLGFSLVRLLSRYPLIRPPTARVRLIRAVISTG